MEKRYFCRVAGCLAMFIAVLAAVTSCREKPFSEDIGIESREVEIPPSGGRCRKWMQDVPLDVDCPGTCGNRIYRGYHIQ